MKDVVKKYWWVAAGVVVIFGWLGGGGIKKEKESLAIPTPTTVKERETTPRPTYSSETGAVYISPTEEEEKEFEAIRKLRAKVPVKTETITVDFSYEISKFTVEFKDKTNKDNLENFYQWRKNEGYEIIPLKYFATE